MSKWGFYHGFIEEKSVDDLILYLQANKINIKNCKIETLHYKDNSIQGDFLSIPIKNQITISFEVEKY